MLAEILRRYQHFNPLTGEFDQSRLMTEYAELLGINYVYLSQMYSGARKPGMETFAKLMRAFPTASAEIGLAIAEALKPEPDAAVAV